jgi:hypothetical protein
MNRAVKERKPSRGSGSTRGKGRNLKDTAAILQKAAQSETESVSTEGDAPLDPVKRYQEDCKLYLDPAVVARIREDMANWEAYREAEKLQLAQLEPLDHPGTPEYDDLVAHLKEMAQFDKMPHFRSFMETLTEEEAASYRHF